MELYNSPKRSKEPFVPLKEGRVGMYVCGVTVYDLCHIGHARSAIVFDVLYRYLRARGMDVTYVRNFTDIDDKIINRAKELGKSAFEVASHYIEAFYQDMDALMVLRPTFEPKATMHISGMIEMVEALLSKGHAYVSDGDVYFDVLSFPGYGQLSGRKLDEMLAGARVEVGERKRHPMDFALWKAAKPGEPFWDSPWGKGRPGWHLECSVMSNHYLGNTFDIHGGGLDLIFPHHENERAQSLCANGGEFARFWVHNGFVTVESEKMSKSLGNFITIRDALKLYHPEVLRFFLLSKHYRTPLDFSKEALASHQAGLVRIYRTLERLQGALSERQVPERELETLGPILGSVPAFLDAMEDDLNTPGAIAALFGLVKEINSILDQKEDTLANLERLLKLWEAIYAIGKVLGILNLGPKDFFDSLPKEGEISEEEIKRLVEERAISRSKKDYKRADEIRAYLKSKGVILEDGPKGTTWRWDV